MRFIGVRVIKIRPSIALFDDDKVLLMRYRYGETDVWGIPGGGIAGEETLVETLERELQEELGIGIDVGDVLCLVETLPAGKVQHTLHCVFAGRVSGGLPAINPSQTTALAVEWVSTEEIGGLTLYPPVNNILVRPVLRAGSPVYLGVLSRPWF